MEELLTVGEVAIFLRVKPQTVYAWAYRKQIPSQKVGWALRFDKVALQRWLEAQKRDANCDE